jgi:hypothetical protein
MEFTQEGNDESFIDLSGYDEDDEPDNPDEEDFER